MKDINISNNLIERLLEIQDNVKNKFYLWIELDSMYHCIDLRFDCRNFDWHCRFIIRNLEELQEIEERLDCMYREYLKTKESDK